MGQAVEQLQELRRVVGTQEKYVDKVWLVRRVSAQRANIVRAMQYADRLGRPTWEARMTRLVQLLKNFRRRGVNG